MRWDKRILNLSNRSSHLGRGCLILRYSIRQWELVINGEDSLNHWHFIVIFIQLAIKIIIIDIVEEGDILLEWFSVGARGNVNESFLVEGDGTDLRLQVIVDSAARCVVWAHRHSYWGQVQRFEWKFHSTLIWHEKDTC